VDYGEVLCHAADPAGLVEMARAAHADPAPFTDAYWSHRPGYDRGELDGPSFWRLVGETVGVAVGDELTTQLVERDIELWTRLDDRMLAWANGVADRGVPTGLLSNMVREIGVHLRDTLRLFEGFTSVTYSYELGLVKPDPDIYLEALASLGAAPEEALFVDDREVNIDAAHAVGMHVHHFRGHEGLVAEIARRYVLVPTRS